MPNYIQRAGRKQRCGTGGRDREDRKVSWVIYRTTKTR